MELPVTVYTPESPLKHPAKLLRGMFRDVLAARELAWRLFVRDLSARTSGPAVRAGALGIDAIRQPKSPPNCGRNLTIRGRVSFSRR